MQIFISHKSDDKMWAREIKKRLDKIEGLKVWVDMYELSVGDPLGKIDGALSDSDAVIVLYSSTTDVSEWVAKEMQDGERQKKRIIPGLVDGTKPSENPILKDRLYVDFSVLDPGLGHLDLGLGHLVLSTLLPQALDQAGFPSHIPSVRDYEADISHCIRDLVVNHEAFKERVDEEKFSYQFRYWRDEARSSFDELMSSLVAVLEDMSPANRNRGMLQGMIGVLANMQRLLDELLTELGGLEDGTEQVDPMGQREAVLDDDLSNVHPEIAAPPIESYSSDDARAEIREFLVRNFDISDAYLEKRVIDLHYFIERSPGSMAVLVQVAEEVDDPAVKRAIAALLDYLDDPRDLLPEANWGYIGYLDDAWMIHNLAFRLIEATGLEPSDFPVNWDDLVESDEFVRHVLIDDILGQLEQYLVQLVGIMFAGHDDYAPAYFLDGDQVPRFFMSSAVRTIESYSDEEAHAEIREFLENKYGFKRRELEEWVHGIHYFIERSPYVRAWLTHLASVSDDANIREAISALRDYLDDPHDLLPEADWGYIGYLDDAWLIHHLALKVLDAVELDTEFVQVDWDDLIDSDSYASAVLPDEITERLQATLEQLFEIFMS